MGNEYREVSILSRYSLTQPMVAINNDPKSPVFEQVDYGIVDESREFVPVLIEKIKEYQRNGGCYLCTSNALSCATSNCR